MALQQADLDQIVTHIKPQFSLWIMEQGLDKPAQLYEMELRERTIRVEEELKHQRELMQQGFKEMEKRFDLQREEMVSRFEKVDQRFEKVDQRFEKVDQRFEKMDRRFELQHEEMNKRLELQREEMNTHFDLQREATNKRFDLQREEMNKRFEQVDARFEALTKRIDRFMIWSFGSTVTVAGIVITILRFWP